MGITLLCPGYIQTPFLDEGGKFGRKLVNRSPEQRQQLLDKIAKFKPMSSDLFAKKALDLIAKNREIIILPYWYRLFLWVHGFFPFLTRMFLDKSYGKTP